MGVNSRDKILDYLWSELRIINRHLPYKRISLCELEKMDIPRIVLRDGTIHLIDPVELRLLKKLGEDDPCRIRVPLIIEASPSLGEGTFVVRDPMDKLIVSRLLNISYVKDKPLIIYRPHVYELREKLPTTTTIVFSPR